MWTCFTGFWYVIILFYLNTTHMYLHRVDNSVCICVYRTRIWHGISKEDFHLLCCRPEYSTDLVLFGSLYDSGSKVYVAEWTPPRCQNLDLIYLTHTCLLLKIYGSSFSSVISFCMLACFQLMDTSLYSMKSKKF